MTYIVGVLSPTIAESSCSYRYSRGHKNVSVPAVVGAYFNRTINVPFDRTFATCTY